MNLENILEQIILDSENYNKFLKLQDEKQVYEFLCEKYNYNENFENFCKIVNKYKSEVKKIFRDKNEKELEKISGGIDLKKWLRSASAMSMAGLMAYSSSPTNAKNQDGHTDNFYFASQESDFDEQLWELNSKNNLNRNKKLSTNYIVNPKDKPWVIGGVAGLGFPLGLLLLYTVRDLFTDGVAFQKLFDSVFESEEFDFENWKNNFEKKETDSSAKKEITKKAWLALFKIITRWYLGCKCMLQLFETEKITEKDLCVSYSYAWGKFTEFLNSYHEILRGPNNTSTNYITAKHKMIHITKYFDGDVKNFSPKTAGECQDEFIRVGEWFSDISLLNIFHKVQNFTEKSLSILWTNTNLIKTADNILNEVHPLSALDGLAINAATNDGNFGYKYPYLQKGH
ncbi:MAG: hypothetical protein J6K87_02320 [Clostridia bacterium]|nr:hypothetical protein [Clostridia bacterium]